VSFRKDVNEAVEISSLAEQIKPQRRDLENVVHNPADSVTQPSWLARRSTEGVRLVRQKDYDNEVVILFFPAPFSFFNGAFQ
jgi:hypothetical protein